MSDKLENTKSLILAIQSSMNFSRKRALKVPGDDDPVYPQRKEWCEYVIDLAEKAKIEIESQENSNE